MGQLLPLAPDKYDAQNEQQTRRTIEDRIFDVEAQIYAFRTTAGTLRLSEGDLTLANGSNNDVSPGYSDYARIAGPTASFTITGIAGGEAGRVLFIRNTTAYQMTIANQSASSTAGNRIVTNMGGDLVLLVSSGASVTLEYDGTLARWVLIAYTGLRGTLYGPITVSYAGLGLDVTNTTNSASNQVAKWSSANTTRANSDSIYHSWYMANSVGTQKEFGRQALAIANVTSGAEEGQWYWYVMKAGTLTATMIMAATALAPNASDGLALGTSSLMWSDIYLASGAVINFNNGDVVLTHATNSLTLTGAANGLGIVSPSNAGSSADILVLKPADYGTSKCGIFFSETSSANTMQVQMYDGTSNSGTLVFKAAGVRVAADTATAATASTYSLGLADVTDSAYVLTFGHTSGITYIQSWSGNVLHINNQGNNVTFFAASNGNIKVGGTAVRGTTEGSNHIDLYNGTAPVGTLTNGASFYCASGEMRVMDASGNSTLLSPHDDDNYWVFDSVDTSTGKRLRIDVEKMLRRLNERFGWQYVHDLMEVA